MQNHVLITRPEADAVKMAELIKQKGYNVTIEPFLDVNIYKVLLDDLEQYTGVIFTSRNGVRAFCQNTPNRFLTVFTVGDATRELAIESGFDDVQSASGDLVDLEELLDEAMPDEQFLYVRGEHVSRDLSRPGVKEKILYGTETKREIPKEVAAMIGEGAFSQVLFFSKRTAEGFVKLIRQNGLEQALENTKALCLGSSMVESVSVLPWQSVEVAQEPNQDSLLNLL